MSDVAYWWLLLTGAVLKLPLHNLSVLSLTANYDRIFNFIILI